MLKELLYLLCDVHAIQETILFWHLASSDIYKRLAVSTQDIRLLSDPRLQLFIT